MTTPNDRAVLNRILNPLLPAGDLVGDKEIQEDVYRPTGANPAPAPNLNFPVLAPITHDGIEESKKLEREGVQQAESGNVKEAISIFSQAIEVCPINPSAYNNRAQAYRLEGNIQDALNDLNKAIELSQGRGKSGCQALVQRAMITRLQGDNDKAREDFEAAAKLGSSFAKMQAVSLNPYAAMCNKMLSQVFEDLKKGNSQ